MPIPALEPSGILPPYFGSAANSADMSPYATSLVEIAQRFCTTAARQEIFRGLLQYRQRLNAIGFSQGFQWLSGSFLEDIEALEQRGPKDVDVVTLYRTPPGIQDVASFQLLLNTNSAVFDRERVKATFKVDAQFIWLNNRPEAIVDQTRFWFGLFSHRRNGLWKGLLRVPLEVTADDTLAEQLVTP